MFWFYKLAALVGLESSSEETWLISDVAGVPLDIAGRDHSMIYKQKEDVLFFPIPFFKRTLS